MAFVQSGVASLVLFSSVISRQRLEVPLPGLRIWRRRFLHPVHTVVVLGGHPSPRIGDFPRAML